MQKNIEQKLVHTLRAMQKCLLTCDGVAKFFKLRGKNYKLIRHPYSAIRRFVLAKNIQLQISKYFSERVESTRLLHNDIRRKKKKEYLTQADLTMPGHLKVRQSNKTAKCIKRPIYDISSQQNRRRTFRRYKLAAGQTRLRKKMN